MKRMIVLLWLSVALFSICTARVRADEITLTQTVQAGLMAQYPLEIHNDSSVDHHYQLAIDGLPGLLTATFVQNGPVLDSITVPANGYEPIKLRVEVPAETPVGHYTAQFTATRDDGLSLVYPVTLNVENTYAVQIISQNVNVNTFSGQEFTFEATVANTGAAPVTNLSLKVGTPAKWVTQVEPAVVDQLAANANITYQVRVLVPASQITIDQPVPLTVTGDQVSSPESTIMVRVQKSPNYLIAAGAVMGLAVAGMLIYFRMKGRR